MVYKIRLDDYDNAPTQTFNLWNDYSSTHLGQYSIMLWLIVLM